MKSGRKSKYETHIEPNFEVILGLLRKGRTQGSVARLLGVSVSAWEKYKTKFPDFLEVIRRGSLDSCALVVNNLFRRAVGYEFDEIHTEITDFGTQKGKGKKINQPANQRRVIKKITKQVPPDVGALVFWLCNCDPKNWKNVQNIKLSGDVKNSGVLLMSPPQSKKEWLKFYKENVEGKQELQETKDGIKRSL